MTKSLLVALQGRRDMDCVRRISVQNLVLRDEALGAFGKEHLVPELERRTHLAAHDKVRVWFEDGIDLLGICQLLSVEYAAARLIDYSVSQTTIMFNLLPEARDRQVGKQVFAARLAGVLNNPSGTLHDLLGNPDERTICCGLALLPLP